MQEIKQKFINAIKAIDFEKLSVVDLGLLAGITLQIKDIDNDCNDYVKLLLDTFDGKLKEATKETLKDLR